MSQEPKKVDRRNFLYIGLGVLGLAALGVATYIALNPPVVTQTTTVPTTTIVTTTISKPYEGISLAAPVETLPCTQMVAERLPEFEKQTGIKVDWIFMPETDRRAKIRLDATTGAGTYQIFGIDIMYIPEFAEAKWIVPIKKYLDADYDFDDILPGFREAYGWKGEYYGVPVYGETTLLMYRKDLFELEGIKVPTTMDELWAAAEHFYRPPNMYGIALRGIRGEGLNVYTWTGFLRAFGGEYLKDGVPVFNSQEAIQATTFYRDIIKKFGPPGVSSFSWEDVEEIFKAGKCAMIIDASDFATRLEDPTKSLVAGKVGYALVPSGPAGRFPSIYTFGLSISAIGCKTEKIKEAAGHFISWATSKESEKIRAMMGDVSIDRESIFYSDLYKEKFGKYPGYIESVVESYKEALPDYRPRIPEWPEIGDKLGIVLEEIFAGTKDVKTGLNEAVDYAKKILKK
ncbi:MAG: sugar ABC transporter substrate-binding protein [Nitrososphaeria archaeon]